MKFLDDLAEGIVKTDRGMTERFNTNRKKRWYNYSITLLLINIFVPIIMLLYVLTEDLLSVDFLNLFYTTFAAAALISSALFLDIYITCESYKYRLPYKVLTPIIIQICLIALVVWLCGLENIVNALVNGALVDALKPVLAGIGCIAIIVPSIYLAVSSRQPGDHKNQNSTKTQDVANAQTIAPEVLCKKLQRAISSNSIPVSFIKKQWEFMPGETIFFGYDKNTDSFVFVSDTHSKVVEYKRIVYLDYEDYLIDKTNGTGGMIAGAILGGMMMGVYGAVVCGAEGRLMAQGKRIQRIIKFYYLNKSGKEQTLTFTQDFNGNRVYGDGGINKLKDLSDNANSSISEIIFRRKLRYMCADFDKEIYLSRPFLKDDWFSILKETLEGVTNSRTNGYALFRQLVIDEEHYMNDGSVHTIVHEMSRKTPDYARIRQEARTLCIHDSVAAVGENAKAAIKGLFSKKNKS